jgi:hypothetical protein
MNKKLFSIALMIGLFGCSGNSDVVEKKDGEVVSALAADAKTDAELEKELKEIQKEEERRIAEEKARTTTLSFDKLKHDFGNVGPNSVNITTFKVTNTGDKPLIIEDVSASCGCTTPKKPEKPIAPGKSDVIEVKFEPKPDQRNEIIKTVTVTANTPEKVHKVDIRAFVLGK